MEDFIRAYAASSPERGVSFLLSGGRGDTPAGRKGQGVLACSRSAHLRKVESPGSALARGEVTTPYESRLLQLYELKILLCKG